ncbi:MAG TPA: agmatine deiminase family protein [Terriglobales bacterium]|nr:agmatine deiminase family protein [Terriglobales bacterium]
MPTTKTKPPQVTLRSDTPAAEGYRMPAEWEQHSSTWIAWPHNPEDWPGKFEPIPWVYAEIVRHLSAGEKVNILVNDAVQREAARKVLRQARVDTLQVRFYTQPTDRVWTRDSGAIFVAKSGGRKPGKLGATLWRFNAWAKYSDWTKDQYVSALMASATEAEAWQPVVNGGKKQTRLVLEGGSIDVNGQGTILTTEECLLSKKQQRNPGVTRAQYEKGFAEYLEAPNTVWLKNGIVGDDTHGHVDDMARFVAADTVLIASEKDKRDENYELLRENIERLRAARLENGRRIKVKTLPMPRPVFFQGQRLPASYANFYIANGTVLVPTFNDPNDRVALNTLAEIFSKRKVVGIYCGDFIWGLGAIHCMTQQQPAV